MININDESNFSISFGENANTNEALKIENYGSLHSGGWGDISTVTFKTRNNTMATIIIDGGCTKDVNQITNIIKEKRVDIVIFSHWHLDHVMGFTNSTDTLNSKLLLFGYCEGITSYSAEPEDIIKKINTTDIKDLNIDKQHLSMLSLIKDDMNIKVNTDNAKIRLFTPDMRKRDYSPSETVKENQLSLCTSVSLGNFKYLSMGDITAETCPHKLFQEGCKYSMVKIPHHGSYYNTNDNFLLKEYIESKEYETTYIISGTGSYNIKGTIKLLLGNGRNNVVLVSGNNTNAVDTASTIKILYNTYPDNFVFCENLTTSIDSNGNALATGIAVKVFEGEFVKKYVKK